MADVTYDIGEHRRVFDVADEIARYVPDTTQWAVLLMRARKRTTGTAEFFWFDEDVYVSWTRVVGSYGDSDTEIPVQDATAYAPKDILKVPRTGEVMFVTASDPTTNT